MGQRPLFASNVETRTTRVRRSDGTDRVNRPPSLNSPCVERFRVLVRGGGGGCPHTGDCISRRPHIRWRRDVRKQVAASSRGPRVSHVSRVPAPVPRESLRAGASKSVTLKFGAFVKCCWTVATLARYGVLGTLARGQGRQNYFSEWHCCFCLVRPFAAPAPLGPMQHAAVAQSHFCTSRHHGTHRTKACPRRPSGEHANGGSTQHGATASPRGEQGGCDSGGAAGREAVV